MTEMKTIAFPNIFNSTTGKCVCNNGYLSINDCISLLLTTARGELFGDPSFGSRLYEYMYEHNDAIMNDLVTNDIIETISRYEPRVIITENDIVIDNQYNKVNITINYYIKRSATYELFQLVMLKEGEENG